MKLKLHYFLLFIIVFAACKSSTQRTVPVVGFLDLLQDETLEQAKKWYVNTDAVHDFSHIERVYRMAERLAKEEGADLEIVRAVFLKGAGFGDAWLPLLQLVAYAAVAVTVAVRLYARRARR